MDGVLAKWEAAITSRLGTPPATGAAATGLRDTAMAACTTGRPFFVQNRANDQKKAMLKVWKISFQTCFAMAHGR